MTALLLELADLHKRYALPRGAPWQPRRYVQAVDGVSLTLRTGGNLGIVGESGSGKSTLGRLAMALEKPDSGSIRLAGQDLLALSPAALRAARREFQMVFQDPYGSLDPRMTVARIIGEPLDMLEALSRPERQDRILDALDAVGLRPADADKYPHEFSGGQRQRIAIARALITRPRLIVADEAVSALDVSVQAQVLNLMAALQQSHGVTYLFISHNLAVIDHLCSQVAVMQQGRIVEAGATAEIFSRPQHPYTRTLLAALPGSLTVPLPAPRA